jgi:creatinine amidohydrolase
VLGDPSGASAAEGAELLATITAGLVTAVHRWEVDPAGRLRS